MDRRVSVIPEDNCIVVAGLPLRFSFPADARIHAVQWNNEKQLGQVEYKDIDNPFQFSTQPDYYKYVLPFVELWEAELERKRILEEELETQHQQSLIDQESAE